MTTAKEREARKIGNVHTKMKKVAEETMAAVAAQKYKTPSGRTLSLDKLVQAAVRRSKLYKPDYNPPEEDLGTVNHAPSISVTHESTLEAAYRLEDERPCVLNFASAKHPGGGFLRGSIAQEETIARASALYHTLVEHPEYYEENKRSQGDNIGLYKDYAIYSPDVPIFRNDRTEWLEEPYKTSVLTSPAPNRGAIADFYKDEIPNEIEEKIVKAFYRRMVQVLAIMSDNGHRTIVLGAWGCGIFGNNPYVVSKLFKKALEEVPRFDKVVFAIYDDPNSDTFRAFTKQFGT